MESVYELFRNGSTLVDGGDFHAATVPLRRAAALEPGSSSVREALGRAYFGARRYGEARREFEAVVAREPNNHFALFCLGRSLQMLGRQAEARPPLTLAALLRPDRDDYRLYRDRCARACGPGDP